MMEEWDELSESKSNYSDRDITQRIILHVYDDESKEFTSLTTYHGMIRIYSSETWPSRIFWSLVVVTCLTLFMMHSALMLLFYHSHPTFFKTTDILISKEVLPTITICKVGGAQQWINYIELRHRKDLLASFDKVLVGGFVSNSDLENLAFLENIYANTTGKKFHLKKFLMDNRTPCEPIVTSKRKVNRIQGDDCQQTHYTATPFGYCSSFKWELSSPSLHSFRKDVVSEADELVMIHVHRPTSTRPLNSHGIYVPRGKSAKIVLQPIKRMNLKAGDWGECMTKPVHGQTHLRVPYNRDDCEIDCLAQHYELHCECSPFFADSQARRPCTLTETALCRRKQRLAKDCHCPVECEEMDYRSLAVSYKKKSQRNLSSIEIQMESRHLRLDEQLKRIKPVDLLSTSPTFLGYVAGSMGLFLGMSCVTLLEIFIYLFKSVWGVFNDQRHKTYYLENLLGVDDTGSSDVSQEEIVITTKSRRLKSFAIHWVDEGHRMLNI
ncbi:unnamed protein product [Strongylus vulgaris]|uniref:Amiloride-sensitive sodium channel n=1 Tax=Strongylus vulgaris TaxID=40348 RepID=A0A3P7IN07_STRVU|nr:unnamed protein product [Strongylus vulgaris]